MTIPHLMNCAHGGGGWCLSCVGKQGATLAAAEARIRELEEEVRWLRRACGTLRGRLMDARLTSVITGD